MAAAILPAIQAKAKEFTAGFAEDPIGWLTKTLLKFGTALLIAGLVLGTIGYFLKASATAAANNEINVVGNIGTIFSNIKAPTFTPAATGTAPLSFSLQGVQNFFADTWGDVQAAGSDVAQIGGVIGTLAEDVGIGIADVAKALLAFVMHFPDILWNGLVWGVGGAIADVFNWLFPWLVIVGAAAIIIGLVLHGVRLLWDATVGAAWSEAWNEKAAEWRERAAGLFRKILRVKRAAPAVAHVESAESVGMIAPGPPELPGEKPVVLAPSTQKVVAAEAPPAAPEPPAQEITQPEPETPAAPAVEPAPVPEIESLPLQEPPKRKELENELGEGYTAAKDRMRAQLRAAQVSPTASSA
jgi:hypothetical protein